MSAVSSGALPPRRRVYGPRRLEYGAWVRDLRDRGIWAANWLRRFDDPLSLCAIWTSCRMRKGRRRIDVQRMAPTSLCCWIAMLRRRSVVLVCECKNAWCHRSTLALLLVDLGRHLGLPAIYCGETA